MNNIFEGAKFGDKFVTRDGNLAIFNEFSEIAPYVYLFIEGEFNPIEYTYDGICQINGARYYDIESSYEEPIDDKKLDDIAHKKAIEAENKGKDYYSYLNGFIEGFYFGTNNMINV